jgi:hypothetical protein
MARIATHATCESHNRLDVGVLNRSGLLNASGTLTWPDGHHVTVNGYGDNLKLTYATDREDIQQRISIDKTPVHLGGHRAWFICPGCDRRIAALYFVKQFRCRHCHDLRYRSQRETPQSRSISRIRRARIKLGGTGNLMKRIPRRPRYMHLRTYQRLLKAEDDAWEAYTSKDSH